MILVDTNVWSEAFKPHPAEAVVGWAATHAADLWLSTVVAAELLSGVALMPEGRRRDALATAYDRLMGDYADQIVDFDRAAARRYATVLAQQVRHGRSPGTADTQIAATALACGMALATRNVRHFEGLGIDLIDPWQA